MRGEARALPPKQADPICFRPLVSVGCASDARYGGNSAHGRSQITTRIAVDASARRVVPTRRQHRFLAKSAQAATFFELEEQSSKNVGDTMGTALLV